MKPVLEIGEAMKPVLEIGWRIESIKQRGPGYYAEVSYKAMFSKRFYGRCFSNHHATVWYWEEPLAMVQDRRLSLMLQTSVQAALLAKELDIPIKGKL